jgi:hypothetical protein
VRDAIAKAFPGTYVNGQFIDPATSQAVGKAMYDQLAAIANKRGAAGMRAVEPALRAVGIPGIRYLDGNSRGADSGTSNFVVFAGEEKMLRILDRNGKPIGRVSEDAGAPAAAKPVGLAPPGATVRGKR